MSRASRAELQPTDLKPIVSNQTRADHEPDDTLSRFHLKLSLRRFRFPAVVRCRNHPASPGRTARTRDCADSRRDGAADRVIPVPSFLGIHTV